MSDPKDAGGDHDQGAKQSGLGDKAKALFAGLPRWIDREIYPQVERLIKQGAAEGGSFLYNGHGYVPYGEGQNSIDAQDRDKQVGVHGKAEEPNKEQEKDQQEHGVHGKEAQEQKQERGGRKM
jgi:hypothetical protein